MFASDVKRGAPVPQDTQEPSLSVPWTRSRFEPPNPPISFLNARHGADGTFEFSSPVLPSPLLSSPPQRRTKPHGSAS